MACSCARHGDGSVTTSLCSQHAKADPCATMAAVTGTRRRGSIKRGKCSACGWSDCKHPGGFRADDGRWECSRCGHLFASYEAWGTETGNEDAVAAVKTAIERDIRAMKKED